MTGMTVSSGLVSLMIAVVGGFVVMYFTSKGLSEGSLPFLASAMLLPLFPILMTRLGTWFILECALYYTWIYLPGLPNSLSLSYVVIGAMIPVLMVQRLLRPVGQPASFLLKLMVVGYFCTVLFTIWQRGFGVRALGSETWGGSNYLPLFVALPFFLVCDGVLLTPRQWRTAVACFFLGGLVPSIAEMVFILGKGEFWFLYTFIRPDGASAMQSLNVISGSEGVLRFQVSKYVAMLFVMMLALYPFRRPYRWRILLSFVLAVFFIGISGHRSSGLYLLLLIPAVIYFTTGRFPAKLFVLYGLVLVLVIPVMFFAGQKLPLSVQRSFSWVPFADISSLARDSATGTLTWRMDVWKRLLEQLPDYWLIGKGLAFHELDIPRYMHTMEDTIQWAVVTHNYHNGPLSLLIDMGVFGFFFGSGILLAGAVRHVRLLKAGWHDESLRRIHCVLTASYCVDVFRFYAIHGDASRSILLFVFQLVMLEGVYRSDLPAASPAAEPVRDD